MQSIGMQSILAETIGPVARLTFNRPEKRNAISLEMWTAMRAALRRWADDAAVRVVVVTGAGDKAFAAGADIGEFDRDADTTKVYAEYERVASDARAALLAFPKPVVAAVNGYCIGAGVAIALAADLRIASETASFAIPGARIGMPCDPATAARLVSVVGGAHARMILLTGERFDAQTACRMNLVTSVVPPAALLDGAMRLAETLAGNAPLALRALKLILDGSQRSDDPAVKAEMEAAIRACIASEDYRIGRSAVLAGRRPDFQGR